MPRGKYNPLRVFIWSIVWVNAEIWCRAGCVSAQFPHLKPPSLPPGNYNFLSHSSQSNFVLFLRSHFTNSFVKLHKSISSPVKPSLGKQWRGNSPFQTKRRIKDTAVTYCRYWGYCTGASCSNPLPQWDADVSQSEPGLEPAWKQPKVADCVFCGWLLIMNSFFSQQGTRHKSQVARARGNLQAKQHNGERVEWVPGRQWRFHSCGGSKWGVMEDDEYLSFQPRRSKVAVEWHADIRIHLRV